MCAGWGSVSTTLFTLSSSCLRLMTMTIAIQHRSASTALPTAMPAMAPALNADEASSSLLVVGAELALVDVYEGTTDAEEVLLSDADDENDELDEEAEDEDEDEDEEELLDGGRGGGRTMDELASVMYHRPGFPPPREAK